MPACVHVRARMYMYVHTLSHVRLCSPIDCSPPGSSVHGISQARILEWVAISYPSNPPYHGSNHCLLHLLHWQVDSFFFSPVVIPFFFLLIYFNWRLTTLQYCSGFSHTLAWISHGCTYVPHLDPPTHLPPHPIPQGHPSAPALSILCHASNLDWWSVSHMIIYMFQCYSLKSSHPGLLPQNPKICSLHLCLFCCLAHRVIITIFLNSIYMC